MDDAGKMTIEEAIKILKEGAHFSGVYDPVWNEALKMAIKALEQDPCDNCDYLDGDGCRLTFEFEQFGKASDECPKDNNVSISRGVFDQVRWERDVAIGQLKELGYEFGEKIEPCDDAVSRSEVIKSIDGREDVNGKVDAESVRTDIVLIPPVNPQNCDKCEVGNPCLYCKHEFEPQESEVNNG